MKHLRINASSSINVFGSSTGQATCQPSLWSYHYSLIKARKQSQSRRHYATQKVKKNLYTIFLAWLQNNTNGVQRSCEGPQFTKQKKSPYTLSNGNILLK